MVTNDSADYLSNDDLFLLAKGEWYRSYDKMGAHPAEREGASGFHFAVWAPDVRSVHVIGDFNGWDEQANPLFPATSGGVWQGFVAGAQEGQRYKYLVETQQGERLYKADPYAFWTELIPGTASRLYDPSGYEWHDADWLAARRGQNRLKSPLNIFEVHLGSWMRHDDGLTGTGEVPPEGEEGTGSYLSYDELSDELVSYVKEMGYSHVELLPVMEHPFDGSWGYQVTGYYAPTSRYGEPKAFMHFVDACHEAGIGVILDWVPGGFCRDAQGLSRFNGSKLYEAEEHPNWGTFKFDFSRGEVRTFLISNLLWWVNEYHADGIRMDGVTSMLYLNFGVDDPSRKRFNARGTEEDLDASAFLRQCNSTVGTYNPDVMMIAEESTAWPLVTYPPEVGGLGFNFKWDMGWMNDTLHYMQTDFPFRPGNHRLLTFSIMYAFNENFILPLSHDEVVHGKCSLIVRQPGDYWRQFAGLRALAFYQMTHPGGKLNFMGNEIGQFIEWRYYEGIQYFMVDEFAAHRKQQHFVAALNRFYNEHPGLWQRSQEADGFQWIDADNAQQSTISFVRHADDPADDLVVLINFDVNARENFRLGIPEPGYYEEAFSSDAEEFGGSGVVNEGVLATEDVPWNGCKQSVVLRVPPLGGTILRFVKPLPKKEEKPARKPAAGKAAPKASGSAQKAEKPATKKPATKKPAAEKPVATKKPAAKRTEAEGPAAKKAEGPAAKKAEGPATPKAPARPRARRRKADE